MFHFRRVASCDVRCRLEVHTADHGDTTVTLGNDITLSLTALSLSLPGEDLPHSGGAVEGTEPTNPGVYIRHSPTHCQISGYIISKHSCYLSLIDPALC